MGILKKLTALFLSVILMLSMTACSDVSWAIKTENTSLPVGVYIYYMSDAYGKAYNEVGESSSDILKKTIDDKSVNDYVKDEAMESCKKLIATENMFDEMGLSLSDEDKETAKSTTDSYWKSYGSIYEKMGIAKSSFDRAYTMFNLKKSKIIEAKYGDEGTEKLSDDEVKAYFTEHYTNYSYFKEDTSELESNDDVTTRELESDEEADRIMREIENNTASSQTGDESGESVSEKMDAISKDFEEYANRINEGASYDDIFNEYKDKYSASDSDNVLTTENLEETNENSLPEDVLSGLKELENNKSAGYNSSEGGFYLVYKYDINDNLSYLDTDENKAKVENALSSEKFDNLIKETADNLNVEVNQKAIDKYQPSLIENSRKKSK